jgi:Flp pilus assembly protein CpaB
MQLAQRLLSTRGGTFVVAGVAALVAGVVLLLYLNRYRDSVQQSGESVPVLVAGSLIEKGTPGNVVGTQGLFQVKDIVRSQLENGALTDPATLRGRFALHDIYPDQQLTADDFSAAASESMVSELSGEQRAISIPLDSAHGMIGNVLAGDRVDVLAGFNIRRVDRNGIPMDAGGQARPVLKVIMEDIFVLDAPTENSGGLGGSKASNVSLRVTDRQAADLAFAAENGKIWVVLRPRTGAEASTPDIVTLETLLLGVKPVTALKSFGGEK